MRHVLLLVLLLAVAIPYLSAKDVPFQVVTWPESGPPALRFTFSKFKEIGEMGREHTYVTDIIAERFSAMMSVTYVCSLPISPISLNLEKVKRKAGGPDSGQVTTWKGTSLADRYGIATASKSTSRRTWRMHGIVA